MHSIRQKLLLLLDNRFEKTNELDIESIVAEAERSRIYSELYYVLREKKPNLSLSKRQMAQLNFRYLYYKFRTDIYIKELALIQAFSIKHNVRLVLIKGIANSLELYNNPYMRSYGDIDIIVRNINLIIYANLLKKLGYQNYDTLGEKIYQLNERKEEHYNFHELTLYKVVHGIRVELEIKHTSSAVNLEEMNDLLVHTKKVKIGSCYIECLNSPECFYHVCRNTYSNSELNNKHNIRDYFEVAQFIRKQRGDLFWREFGRIVDYHQKHNEIKSVLEHAAMVFRFNHLYANAMTVKDRGESSGYVKWRVPFVQRLIDGVSARDYFGLYIDRCYSSLNPNYYSAPHLGKCESLSIALRHNRSKGIILKMINYPTYLMIIIKKNGLSQYLESHAIIIRFINGDYEKDWHFNDYYITTDENRVPVCFLSYNSSTNIPFFGNNKMKYTNEMAADLTQCRLAVQIPKKTLGIRDRYLCYNILTIHFCDLNVPEYYVFDGSEYEDLNPKATPGVLVLD